MKRPSFFLVVIFIMALASCAKTTNNNPANSSSSLWPLKAGNNWVYQDSVFDVNANLQVAYPDSTFITAKTTNSSGAAFYGYSDSLGWFGTRSYVAVSSSNSSLYVLDSLNATAPYIFFSTVPNDNYVIGSNQDLSIPSCIGTDALVGFATAYNVAGYNCYKNIYYEKDCNNNTSYTNVIYVSPGVGVVRIEEYSLVPGSSSKALYLDYSQTLKSYNLK